MRVPTGFGKTAGVVIAWLWNRVHHGRADWPRRLVFCLPMRTLVEQTERAIQEWLCRGNFDPQPKVHVLLGGMSISDWHLDPGCNAILIGTQDMLLSRALNRGYGAGRARWPMEYGLLNVDCLWVLDEIQLMDVGLATSGQLQAFASSDERGGKLPRPRRTWWMSATLQRDWLRRAPALVDVDTFPQIELEPQEQSGSLWKIQKSIRIKTIPAASDPKGQEWAKLVADVHARGVTLVVTNTVKSALALYGELKKLKRNDTDLRLVHSHFRGAERRQWTSEFLERSHCGLDQDRIIVATQVVEAGVDISAKVLITELAPWASLVQRFGRCGRYGDTGEIVVVDRRHTDETAAKLEAKDDEERSRKRQDADRATARPYDLAELEAAAAAVTKLQGEASPAAIEGLEKNAGREDLLRLYPYAPAHVLTRRELLDLFDTGPDLTGADIDISRFVREGDERDVTIWWWPVPQNQSPHPRLRPTPDALCRIPVGQARAWLFPRGRGSEDTQAEGDLAAQAKSARPRAWVWSYLDNEWERVSERHVYPGQTILVDAAAGGYDPAIGFTGKPAVVPVQPEHARVVDPTEAADSAEEQEDLSEGLGTSSRQYKTITTHGAEVAAESLKLADTLGLVNPVIRKVVELAGVTHDIGKAHPAFAGAIRDRNQIPLSTPLAKAPNGRWHGGRDRYNHSHLGERPGFRHELASALALLELVWRARPWHPALQGGCESVLDATVGRELPCVAHQLPEPQGILAELVELDASALNLVLYLVMCHHGKVRATVPMSPRDQDNVSADGVPVRGVRDGDELPDLLLANRTGQVFQLPQLTLRLDPVRLGLSPRYGPSWLERVLDLRICYGDFQLAWLEALIRAADVRASQISEPLDPLLPPNLAEVAGSLGLEDREADLRVWINQTLSAATSPTLPDGTRPSSKRQLRRGGAKASAKKQTGAL
ncbi:MAG: DEAD/DEAH box helicase [Bryobacteraceae bacterium]|nr:DEAD/DEAH box helicase [Bryobacteraceae bacterium]